MSTVIFPSLMFTVLKIFPCMFSFFRFVLFDLFILTAWKELIILGVHIGFINPFYPPH